MVQQIFNFIGIGILSAVLSVAAIIGNALRIDRDPAVDGPRALVAEFFGLWVAFASLAWSFMVAGKVEFQWILRGVAACAALFTFALAAYFAGTPEVRVRFDEEPTGFDNPITALRLDNANAKSIDKSETPRRDRAWSELDPLK
ncbi:MAG: hypothetical protein WBQ95_12555 [Terracidiphilus sp.]